MIIGTGLDIVEIERIRSMRERLGERFIRRIFTAAEQEFCNKRHDPAPHYAARFAAKEAVFKALGTGWAKGVSWLDCEIVRKDSEAPEMVLYGEAEQRRRRLGAGRVHVTLSHSDQWAVAMVILEK